MRYSSSYSAFSFYLRGLPLEMMFSGRWLASRLRLEVEHVFSEIVQLRFVELRREDGIRGELEKLESGAYARHDGIRLNAHSDNLLE